MNERGSKEFWGVPPARRMTIARAAVVVAAILLLSAPCARAAGSLSQALNRILDAPALQGAVTGAVVARVPGGEVLYARNPDTRLLPASNRKLFTTAAALELLGAGFAPQTRLLATGAPGPDGVLRGDLYLQGGGDALLAPDDLEVMAALVARRGVRRITGDIFGDGAVFSDGPYGLGWEWDDFSDSDFSQIAGLEVNRGLVSVRVTAGTKAGDPFHIAVSPTAAYLPLVDNGRTAAAGTAADCRVERLWNQNVIVVDGSLPPGAVLDQDVPIVDPPWYAATLLAEDLVRHGVAIDGKAFPGKMPAGANTLLAVRFGLPLAQYVARMNKPSDNLLAESLIRLLGAAKGKTGSYAAGHALEMPVFARLGVETAALSLVDGSGIGRRNFVTARAVVQLLRAMPQRPGWSAFYGSLPVAGLDGSLRRRLRGTAAQGNVHAKTGGLTAVNCLSGYVSGRHGDLYAFSLLVNNFSCDASDVRAVEDRFVEYLADVL